MSRCRAGHYANAKRSMYRSEGGAASLVGLETPHSLEMPQSVNIVMDEPMRTSLHDAQRPILHYTAGSYATGALG